MSINLSNAPVAHSQAPDSLAPAELRERSEDSGVFRLAELAPLRPCPEHSDREIYDRFSPMVRRIARKAQRSLPRSITTDDLISAGWVGMSEALLRRPQDMPDDQFEAYSSYRIRGAILDYLRALDPLSRRLRSVSREIQHSTRELSDKLGRAPVQEEIAENMGIPLAQLQRNLADIQEAGMDRNELVGASQAPSTGPSPEMLVTKNEMFDTISKHMRELPERLQVVLTLHYAHECSLREIGEVLGVTESRVCQLHSEAVRKIRARIEGRPFTSIRRRRGRN